MEALSYYDRNIPCLAACPVHTNAGVYVAAIAEGMDREAYLTARLPNPFPSVCGRVCAAPCEDACRRGAIDQPIAIRALKRFVTEQYGVEAGLTTVCKVPGEGPLTDRPESVAIVGGGPAGLAAAHDLRQLGYQVAVYEATRHLGGMMRLGIPEYRLDRQLLDAEIKAIIDLGVSVHLDSRLGSAVSLDQLRQTNDAVFLAFGASLGRGLNIPGDDADGVFRAIEFLININQGFRVDVGERVVVIGGGNVAMDAARTALRASVYEQASHVTAGREAPAGESHAAFTEAVDVARSAIRAGAKDVTVISLESRAEMPAADFEIEESITEGITFVHRRGPLEIETEAGVATGLSTVGVLSVFDDAGRFNPVFDPRDVVRFPADTVIMAIGQAVDVAALGGAGPEINRRGTIETNPESGSTSLGDVWAGGDAAYGPRTLIDAIANGRTAAESIHRYLGGEARQTSGGQMVEFVDFQRLRDTYDRRQRVPIPSLASHRRIGLREVEQVYTEAEARAEAARCLRCFANIQLDPQLCVLCALCVDACPFDLISLVPAANLDDAPVAGTALVIDESRCIRCALCIDRCPTDALSMGVWSGSGVLAALDLVEIA